MPQVLLGIFWLITEDENMKKLLPILLLALLAVLIVNGALFVGEYSATESKNGAAVTVKIPKGATEKVIAHTLKENGVIRYELSFRMKMRKSPYRGKLNYGTFALHKGMCIDDIVDELMNPTEKDKGIKLTIPEGFSAEMIAARCEKLGLVKAEDFLSELEKGKFGFSFINDIPSKDGVKYKLQGYLFPSTYVFKSTASAHDVISVLLAEFEKQYNSVKNLNKNEVSMNDIIISASLIEREAKLDSERSTISGVIRNRIKKGMRLQIDASVVYAISDGLYDVSRVYYKDLEKDSPYNTYKYAGLPVGAICNPGIKSIKAAMQPQESNYLYYRTDNSKNDGSHIFTETFNEHKSKAK